MAATRSLSMSTESPPGSPTSSSTSPSRKSISGLKGFVVKGQNSIKTTRLKVAISSSSLECCVTADVDGAKVEGGGLPAVCGGGKAAESSYVSCEKTSRGPGIKGSLKVGGFAPVPFAVGQAEHGSAFVNSKGKLRHTTFSAPPWDWRGHGDKPTEGKAADIELGSSGMDRTPTLKVSVRKATEGELKRFLQTRALREAAESDDYDTLHAQVTKAKIAGVDSVEIEHGEEILRSWRKIGMHISEGAEKNTLKDLMDWSKITRSSRTHEDRPCTATEDCACNVKVNCGEVLEIIKDSVQDCLSEFGPNGDQLLFEELVLAALAVEDGSVWRAGGKFIFSAFDRNQSVTALTRMLDKYQRKTCSRMLLQMVKNCETRYGGFVTSIQINFHTNGRTFHAQHRDIYSAKQRAGPNCTCSFRKCIGTVCYSVGSSRACYCETMTDEFSSIKPCGDSCEGRRETVWLHSGDAMFFNQAWNSNHTHGIPSMDEVEPGQTWGPRISVAFLLGAEEERNTLYQH